MAIDRHTTMRRLGRSYRPRVPRRAFALVAIALAGATLTGLVVVPAELESATPRSEATTAAQAHSLMHERVDAGQLRKDHAS